MTQSDRCTNMQTYTKAELHRVMQMECFHMSDSNIFGRLVVYFYQSETTIIQSGHGLLVKQNHAGLMAGERKSEEALQS